MANFIVRIDHLSDQELEFFGWVRVHSGGEFSTYWSPRYDEFQPVSNGSPRYLIIDDWNDAQAMSLGIGNTVIEGP